MTRAGVAARRRAIVTAGAGLAVVAATLGMILFDQPEVRALRGVDDTVTIPATTHLARGAGTLTTTTTAPPVTTTTVAPATTVTTVPSPATAPPPPAPVEGLWDTYQRCTRGNHADLTVIPGGTSWTKWDGDHIWLEVSQWHLDAGGWVLCWTLAHEDGHAYVLVTWPGSAGVPPGWPYGPERFADCYAQALVGGQRGTCPDLLLAQELM